jgi:UTP--glucose-1-phosphate uridylyltransferase
MTVRTVVIPAAGLGTRFLPATKAVPKELLPIMDVPALQHVLDEAVGAGCEHVVVVSHPTKTPVERYLRPDADIDRLLRKAGRDEMADHLARLGRDVRVSIVYQHEPLGLGHAVGCARPEVTDDVFAVLLPDELMSSSSLLLEMSAVNVRHGGSVVALKEVPRERVSSYGVIDPAGAVDVDGVVAIRTMVEKPPVDQAPSNLIVIGRYLLTADIFDDIDALTPGSAGELQLTDALRAQALRQPFHGVLSTVGRHDTGTPIGWLEAVIDSALGDPRYADQARALLDSRRNAAG